ncbi:MAG TPA: transporter [Nitrospiria bacterium]|nr:transporter [Nitrospiria bacterium]
MIPLVMVTLLIVMGSSGRGSFAWADEVSTLSETQSSQSAGEPSSPPSQEPSVTQPAEATPEPPPPTAAPEGGAAAVQKALEQPEEKKPEVVVPRTLTFIKGKLQIELIETYVHSSSNQLYIQGFGILPVLVVGPIQVETIRRDLLITTLTTRLKLTEDLQFTLNVPYQFTFNRTSTASGQTGGGTTTQPNIDTFSSGGDLGDISGSLTYQVLTERLNMPSLYVSLGFKGRTGTDIFETLNPSGSGYNSVSFSFNFNKTSDPAVLYAGMGYAYAIGRRDVIYTPPGQQTVSLDYEPGSNISLLFGSSYALNYKLTLSMDYEQSFNMTSKINQQRIADSTTNAISLRFGGVYTINDQASVDLSVAIGLTTDAPNAVVTLRLPWRF